MYTGTCHHYVLQVFWQAWTWVQYAIWKVPKRVEQSCFFGFRSKWKLIMSDKCLGPQSSVGRSYIFCDCIQWIVLLCSRNRHRDRVQPANINGVCLFKQQQEQNNDAKCVNVNSARITDTYAWCLSFWSLKSGFTCVMVPLARVRMPILELKVFNYKPWPQLI